MKLLVLALALLGPCWTSEIPCGSPDVTPITDDSNIVGGRVARPFSWPWQVELCIYMDHKCYLNCGGSIIADQWIMTAAHCVDDKLNSDSSTRIRAGIYSIIEDHAPNEQLRTISEVHIHPKWNSDRDDFDLALLKLNQSIEFTKYVKPVCIASPAVHKELFHEDKKVYVTGWGDIKQGGRKSGALRQVVVPVLNMTECQKDYPKEIDPVAMECAGREGLDSCQGDSGGPMVGYKKSDARWYQIGIVSWGYGCALKGKPGVYSNPSAMCDFIEETVRKPLCH
ncbi:hypothetical protein QR680_013648 [Steinernema hermaphroditum]|uniref:Peptidase S1 domain-containing protein n=1 Tax=Steinernema hermaphroditum TaxID=289476 RepID=A0AA39I8Z7_9BILA|nr:hypothetical protein QR680_013648 [Steinernema hermaphroditum]